MHNADKRFQDKGIWKNLHSISGYGGTSIYAHVVSIHSIYKNFSSMSFKRVKYLTCIHKTFKFCCHRRKWYVLSSKYKLFEALLNCQSMVSHYLVELSLSRAAAKKRVKAYFHWKDADRIIFLVLFVRNEKLKYFQCVFWFFVNNTFCQKWKV